MLMGEPYFHGENPRARCLGFLFEGIAKLEKNIEKSK
jgi:hypothetical protein